MSEDMDERLQEAGIYPAAGDTTALPVPPSTGTSGAVDGCARTFWDACSETRQRSSSDPEPSI